MCQTNTILSVNPPSSSSSSAVSVAATTISLKENDSTTSIPFVKNLKFQDVLDYFIFLLIIFITIYTYPSSIFSTSQQTPHVTTIQDVGYYGWITAISTGLGIIPFLFMKKPNNFYMGVSNALAAGMMIAASYSLAHEGYESDHSPGYYGYHPGFRVILGFLLGVLFILGTKYYLADHEELNVCSLTGSDARKVLMIMLVMTLHSISEGIGIGVSFGGLHGSHLGKFISFSLALHNIPEGIAIALVLTSRGVSNLRTSLLCIFSSIPQPIMAIPSYYFIEKFIPILPVGLGFASGAMLYVAFFELIPEAIEDCKYFYTIMVAIISFCLMFLAQEYAHHTVIA